MSKKASPEQARSRARTDGHRDRTAKPGAARPKILNRAKPVQPAKPQRGTR